MKHRNEVSRIAVPFLKYNSDHDSPGGSQSTELLHCNSRLYLSSCYPRTEQDSGQMSYPESSQRTALSEDVKPCLPYTDEGHGRSTVDTRLPFPSHDAFQLPSVQEHMLSPPVLANMYHGSQSITLSHQTELHNSQIVGIIPQSSTTNFRSPLYPLTRPIQEKMELLDQYESPSQLGSGVGTASELYADFGADAAHDLSPLPSPGSSIPMCNMGWSSVSISGTFDQARAFEPSTTVIQNLDSLPTACQASKHSEQQNCQPAPSSSLALESTKKKKSKMHQCEVCGKLFPRPSGLKTHMNTHNNLKPFPCGFEGCSRTFTVRSNAKRHLRTHGVESIPSRQASSPTYSVGFDTPTIVPPPPTATNGMTTTPCRLRWMPPSLSTCTNATSLVSVSDDESSDEEYNLGLGEQYSSVVKLPCLPVFPSSSERDVQGPIEERNSYAEAPLYPYHPLQFRVLPGPAAGRHCMI